MEAETRFGLDDMILKCIFMFQSRAPKIPSRILYLYWKPDKKINTKM